MIRLICLFAILFAPAVSAADPPPLTDAQKTRLSRLANETKQESDRLKALLGQRQRELAEAYAHYKLDEAKVTKLEAEVLDLQRQLLNNHRKMHVELRELVGEERFNQLRRRLDNMLKSSPKESAEKR